MDVEEPRSQSFRSFIRPRLTAPGPIERASEDATIASQVCSCGKGFIELYCSGDNELLCMPCYYGLHNRCKVQSLKQLSQGIMEAKELEALIKEMGVLKSAIGRVLGDRKHLTVYREQQKKSLIKQTRQLNIRKGYNKLEKELGEKVGVIQDSLQVEQLIQRQKCRRVIREINNHLKNFAHFSDQGNKTGMYIEMHKARENMDRFREVLNDLSNVTNEEQVEANVTDLVGNYYTRDNLGSVMVSRSPSKGATSRSSGLRSSRTSDWASIDKIRKTDYQTPISRGRTGSSYVALDRMRTRTSMGTSFGILPTPSNAAKTVAHVDLPIVKFALKQFTAKTEDDAHVSQVTAIAFLKDERILILDCRNNKLKLFSRFYKSLWVLDMVRSVWDMTFTSDYEIIVTCPSLGRLQHVQITHEDVLFKTGHISTVKECRAICAVGDMLYVSYSGSNPCIRILSSEGIMYRTIPAVHNNERIMQNPLYMLVREEGSLIYISDYSLQRVNVVDQRGTLFHTHDVKPGWPLGMTKDKDGNVVVCVSGVKNIRMIKNDNSGSGILVHSHVFQGDPCAVAFDNEHNMLYVAFEKQNDLRMMYVI